ncbi:hypothetical protein DYB25_001603 [Aphanomyces astaci]|uniref:EamA domain-containing protein n=1 Tax=Aphanomyces astaci TaxID=112090 RepID=A0A397EYW2_APHAT|nr:hypothetical protein DYB36_003215 [Aphanomyces astaci]RHY15041.1 hypothetical protein DYB25_001603 [Aphanomyces astaci]RHY37317.1 hypothetical protein DYB34_000661 [Aphanomyces astaci]RHY69040.1 hypothetical protein DYB30_002724 [Aphanomyces astaci]RHZ08198.1 hypothetical protein DYB31_001641 [Aphanomyces astaci]
MTEECTTVQVAMEPPPQESEVSYTVDLRRASQLAHISYDDLIAGIQTNDEITSIHGLLVDNNVENPPSISAQAVHTLATAGLPSDESRKPRRSLILTTSDLPSQDPRRSRRLNSEPFNGFTVPVKLISLPSTRGLKEDDLESQPLLVAPTPHPPSDTTSKSIVDPGTAFLMYNLRAPNQLVLALPHYTENPPPPPPQRSLGELLRRASRLPSDIKDVSVEASVAVESNHVHLQLAVHKTVPWLGFSILIFALISVSAQGAAMQALVGVPPLLKVVWRFFGATCAYVVLGVITSVLNRNQVRWSSLKLLLSRRVIWESVVCTVSYATFVGTFVWALDHTSVSHAYIFCNAHSLLLVVAKWVTGQPVAPLETVGAIMGIVGGVVTTADGSGGDASMAGSNAPTMGGDLVALAGAVGGVFYLTYAKSLRSQIGVGVFCSVVFTGTWVLVALAMWLLQLDDVQLSMHPQRGFFGWVHHLEVEFVLVVVVTLCGSMGFVSAMKYFPALVVSVTMLLEPVVATAICLALGMAPVPGWLTFVGGFGVIVGTVLVIASARESTETVNVTDAVDQAQALSYDATVCKGSVQ